MTFLGMRYLPLLVPLLAACATGSTFRSGVGDTSLEHPPWYAGPGVSPEGPALAHLPIAWQRDPSQPETFGPASNPGTPVSLLLNDMNAYLGSLGRSALLAVPADSLVRATPPDVRFGCGNDFGDCEARGDTTLGRNIRMTLAVGRPSASWTRAVAAALDSTGRTHVLVLALEIGQYWTRQSGLRGDKSVELGTDHTVMLPWLTSLETPVQVVQLTGALMGRDGRAVRIGAEGMVARRTSLVVSALGGQAMISDADIQELRSLRRTDLPGQPLVWQVALRALVEQLTR